MRIVKLFASTLALSLCVLSITAPVFAQAAAVNSNTRVWIGRVPEIEKYLKEADIVGTEEISVGVTKPRKATLVPGGPVEAIAWKPINPGRYSGYWESYKSEIAAYELDKLLELGMIPPTVEKDVKGVTGAAVMWCPSVQSFKQLGGVPGLVKGYEVPPPTQIPAWMRQITIAKIREMTAEHALPRQRQVHPRGRKPCQHLSSCYRHVTPAACTLVQAVAELQDRPLTFPPTSGASASFFHPSGLVVNVLSTP